MKQIYSPYWDWEDFNNGMYDTPALADMPELSKQAASLLSCAERFANACKQLINDWPIASAVNLTNLGTNRRAWLGQAACNFVAGVPEVATRAACKELTEDQRRKANQIADEAIREYQSKSRAVHNNMGSKGLFGWDS